MILPETKAICRVDENLQMVTFNDDGEDAPEEDDDISPSAARKVLVIQRRKQTYLLRLRNIRDLA